MKYTDPLMGANLKSKTHLQKTFFCFFENIKKGVKNAEFNAEFEYVEKVVKKNAPKQSYKQNKFDELE
jgi:hypothetical protein